jgi:hypothetical protein
VGCRAPDVARVFRVPGSCGTSPGTPPGPQTADGLSRGRAHCRSRLVHGSPSIFRRLRLDSGHSSRAVPQFAGEPGPGRTARSPNFYKPCSKSFCESSDWIITSGTAWVASAPRRELRSPGSHRCPKSRSSRPATPDRFTPYLATQISTPIERTSPVGCHVWQHDNHRCAASHGPSGCAGRPSPASLHCRSGRRLSECLVRVVSSGARVTSEQRPRTGFREARGSSGSQQERLTPDRRSRPSFNHP